MYVPDDSFSTVISASVTIAIIWLFTAYICKSIDDRKWKQERERWKKFKKETNCVLIGIDESGFLGKKYIWKTKDGVIITNRHKN